MNKFLLLTVAALFAAQIVSSARVNYLAERDAEEIGIAYGTNAPQGLFLFMAYVYTTMPDNTAEYCGGTILTPNYGLTAGHCVICIDCGGTEPDKVEFFAGAYNVSNVGEQNGVQQLVASKWVRHPQYNYKTNDNDIAVVTFSEPVQSQYIPICLYSGTKTFYDTTAVAIGWGDTQYTGVETQILQEAQLNIMDRAMCVQKYEETGGTPPANPLCTYDASGEGRAFCKGDSGGPLFIKNSDSVYVQLGVVSKGPAAPCGNPDRWGIWTRVSDYLSWVQSQVPDGNLKTCTNTNA